LIVVRKGATPAFPGQRGFVGGSMGDDSVILEGRDTNPQVNSTDTNIFYTQEGALFSTVHGSGRVMSRTEAAGKKTRSGLIKKHGKVTHVMMQEWLNKEGVILHGGGLDESPHVYRRLKDVL
jgi:tRNA-splicing ligase RtcB